MTDKTYTANAGQTYIPFKENIHVDTLPYKPLDPPTEKLAPLVLNAHAQKLHWVLKSESQHFLPGVTAEMLDWFWANMEKGYYLWAPGSHKRFSWVKSPAEYGFLQSVHMISESVGKGYAVFGGNGIEIHRLDLSYFPFTECLEHVIVEGVFNDLGEFVDMTVHMWDNCEGGSRHIVAAVESTTVTEPPHFVKEMLAEDSTAKIVPPSATDHAEYESSRWPEFLPQLYALWKDHPDPSQNVHCNLAVKKTAEETWNYVRENGAVEI